MELMICGSMVFSKEMIKLKKDLEEQDHKVFLPPDAEEFSKDPSLKTDDYEKDREHCIKKDIFKKAFKQIEKSEAILILNNKKENIEGYIGPSVLMEIAIAHYLNKKIFLLNPPPNINKHRSTHEILIMQPIILNGNLENLK